MDEKINDFKDLRIWQEGMLLAKKIYEVTQTFSSDEKYGLASQMKRAAVSVPSNIAEGFRRGHAKEFKQFLYIARGSLAELETQIRLSSDLGFINNDDVPSLLAKSDYVARMISSMIKKMK
jgi:four helix bundle protein